MNMYSRAKATLVAVVVAVGAALALLPATAGAASPRANLPILSTLGNVSLDQASYTAHESQGYLTITIVRTGNLLGTEHVGYGVKQQDGRDGIDFDAVPSTYIALPPGQALFTFKARIIDRGISGTPVHALAYLYGANPAPLGSNTNSMITIEHDDPVDTRDNANPLGVPGPVNGNVIAGTKLYVDPASPSALAANALRATNPSWAAKLQTISQEPGAKRFWMWNLLGTDVAGQIAFYLGNTQLTQPGTTVMMSSYNLVHGRCGSTATPSAQATYDHYMDQVAKGIGNFHVIYFLEFDSIITSPCLTPGQLAIREAELRYAVNVLEKDPHVVVYLDGGAADALHAVDAARILRQSGVGQAQGFFLNSTHFDWTRTEIGYGEAISKMLGGAHFVINTATSGKGPLVPASRVRSGNEVLCNPPGRGLGPISVTDRVAQQTGFANADGFLWFTNPGGSGGQCVPGAPAGGTFWPAYAVGLVDNWVKAVTGPSYHPTADRRTARKARR